MSKIEESLALNQVLPEALDNIRHPHKSLEKKIEHLIQILEFESVLGKQGLSCDD